MSAILFGSISTLIDTSELQRQAFNKAFQAHGLDWNWSRDDYIAMLDSSGGAQRVADYAQARDADIDAAAVHATKSEIFRELLQDAAPTARPGVIETVQEAKRRELKLGFVTTTSPDNVSALLATLAPDISADTFDVIVDSGAVETPKPDAAAYLFALRALGETADTAVAIEDNVGGVSSAAAAGVKCIAFPNENTSAGDFTAATETVESLDAEHIVALIA
jgi:HAD superfamily hydrolase (TIGR01509 family)